jgi:signal transduction histidine kinase
MTGTPLRRRLIALTAVAIVPLAFMAGIGLYRLGQQQDAQSQRVGIELARSVANAVDTELHTTIAVLQTLATAPSLERDDWDAFRDRAERVLAGRPHWIDIVLSNRTGAVVMDTRGDRNAPNPGLAAEASFARAVQTRQPVVGNLRRASEPAWQFAVHVPIVRSAPPAYVLTAIVSPEAIRDVLTRQQLPIDWVISIIDAHDVRVARSRDHDANLGGRLSESAQRLVSQGGPEGSGWSYALEGDRVFTTYSNLPSGWKAVLGIPNEPGRAAAYRSVAAYGGGILLSIGLGTLGAFWLARTITAPIAGLRDAAEAISRGELCRSPATSIQEIAEVGQALEAAASNLVSGEREREELLRKERLARQAAEAADRAKDEFMAVLSHELRTPLNAVYGWGRMLQSGQLRDEATIARAKDAIVRNADAQVQLIDDLLDLARISSGKMRLDIRRTDLEPLLQAALDSVRPAAHAKGLQIETLFDAQAAAVTGDPARLQQVFWNLLINAVKFTPIGGAIQVRTHRVDGHVEIVVADNGQGIAPHLLPHLFERFRQADSSSTRARRARPGTGARQQSRGPARWHGHGREQGPRSRRHVHRHPAGCRSRAGPGRGAGSPCRGSGRRPAAHAARHPRARGRR